ncbi:hypothetical protein ABZP36_021395 [Zizania latifolia]
MVGGAAARSCCRAARRMAAGQSSARQGSPADAEPGHRIDVRQPFDEMRDHRSHADMPTCETAEAEGFVTASSRRLRRHLAPPEAIIKSSVPPAKVSSNSSLLYLQPKQAAKAANPLHLPRRICSMRVKSKVKASNLRSNRLQSPSKALPGSPRGPVRRCQKLRQFMPEEISPFRRRPCYTGSPAYSTQTWLAQQLKPLGEDLLTLVSL